MMPESIKLEEQYKELFDLARSKPYLTYDEINKHLPAELMAAAEIDEIVMKIMSEFNVELVVSEKKIPVKDKQAKKEGKDKDDEEEGIGPDTEAVVRGNDPVKMYLHEMGCVSLLTREGEVEIAKRIEQGEQQVFSVIIGCPVTIKEVIALGEKLQTGTIRLKEVIRGLEDEVVVHAGPGALEAARGAPGVAGAGSGHGVRITAQRRFAYYMLQREYYELSSDN